MRGEQAMSDEGAESGTRHSGVNFGKRFFLIVAILLGGFAAVIWERDAVRGHYFAWRLRGRCAPEETAYFVAGLTALGADAASAVRGMARDEAADVREWAVLVLRTAEFGGADEELVRLVSDEDARIGEAAAVSIVFRRQEQAEGLLRPLLEDGGKKGEEGVRGALGAASAIGRVWTWGALCALCDAAGRHSDAKVRAQAVESVIQMIRENRALGAAAGNGGECDVCTRLTACLDDRGEFEGRLSLERQIAGAMGMLPSERVEEPGRRRVSEIAAQGLRWIDGDAVAWSADAAERARVLEACRKGLAKHRAAEVGR